METHNNPEKAPSDGPNMINIKSLRGVIEMLLEFDALAKKGPLHFDILRSIG